MFLSTSLLTTMEHRKKLSENWLFSRFFLPTFLGPESRPWLTLALPQCQSISDYARNDNPREESLMSAPAGLDTAAGIREGVEALGALHKLDLCAPGAKESESLGRVLEVLAASGPSVLKCALEIYARNVPLTDPEVL
jgi:hypothetical protein